MTKLTTDKKFPREHSFRFFIESVFFCWLLQVSSFLSPSELFFINHLDRLESCDLLRPLYDLCRMPFDANIYPWSTPLALLKNSLQLFLEFYSAIWNQMFLIKFVIRNWDLPFLFYSIPTPIFIMKFYYTMWVKKQRTIIHLYSRLWEWKLPVLVALKTDDSRPLHKPYILGIFSDYNSEP